MARVRLCAVDELAPGEARRFRLGGTSICLARVGDRFHAVGDTCTHQDVSLAEGEIDEDDGTIECWKHGSAFSLETGEPLSLPATRPTPVYAVSLEDGGVRVELP
jgi:3-phenylpropionate/trans-cinnamate dioxygenase ferredoxin subunit